MGTLFSHKISPKSTIFDYNSLKSKKMEEYAIDAVMQDIKATDDSNLIHVFLIDKKKRGKKITRIKGLEEIYDYKKILAHLKKTQKCNGAIKTDEKTGAPIIELSGDHRE